MGSPTRLRCERGRASGHARSPCLKQWLTLRTRDACERIHSPSWNMSIEWMRGDSEHIPRKTPIARRSPKSAGTVARRKSRGRDASHHRPAKRPPTDVGRARAESRRGTWRDEKQGRRAAHGVTSNFCERHGQGRPPHRQSSGPGTPVGKVRPRLLANTSSCDAGRRALVVSLHWPSGQPTCSVISGHPRARGHPTRSVLHKCRSLAQEGWANSKDRVCARAGNPGLFKHTCGRERSAPHESRRLAA